MNYWMMLRHSQNYGKIYINKTKPRYVGAQIVVQIHQKIGTFSNQRQDFLKNRFHAPKTTATCSCTTRNSASKICDKNKIGFLLMLLEQVSIKGSTSCVKKPSIVEKNTTTKHQPNCFHIKRVKILDLFRTRLCYNKPPHRLTT